MIYKAIVGILKLIFKSHFSIFTMIAGCVGGHFIFGKWNPINAQIVMYLLSRNLLGFAGLMRKSKLFPQRSLFTLLAMLCWGTVMYLYSIDRDVLQNSLQSSMEYLYDESEYYCSWKDFIPFLNNRQDKPWMSEMKLKIKDRYAQH